MNKTFIIGVVLLMISASDCLFGMMGRHKLPSQQYRLPARRINPEARTRVSKSLGTSLNPRILEISAGLKKNEKDQADLALQDAIFPKELLLCIGGSGAKKALRPTCKVLMGSLNSTELTFMQAICNNSRNLRQFILDTDGKTGDWIRNARLLDAFAFSMVTDDIQTAEVLNQKLEGIKSKPQDMQYRYHKYCMLELMRNNREKTFELMIKKDFLGCNNYFGYTYYDGQCHNAGTIMDDISQSDFSPTKKEKYLAICRANGCVCARPSDIILT